MAFDMNLFNRPGFADIMRAEEEFQARKQAQLAAQQMQAQQFALQQKNSEIENKLREAQLSNIPFENKLKMLELGQKINNETIVPEGSTPPANDIMSSLMNVESGGNPNALSPKGAAGLYQIMPDTARDPGFGVKPLQGWDGKDPRTAPPEEQARFAKEYFGKLQDIYGGDTQSALAAYNAGAGTVNKARQKYGNNFSEYSQGLPQETQNYVPKVLAGAGQPTEEVKRPRFLMKGGKPYTEGLKPGMQWAMDENGRRYAAPIPGTESGGEDGFKNENTLRDEFNTLGKPFRDVQDAYTRMVQATKDPSAAGDMAAIFNYMKILDPGSTVREGEFATAQNATGVPGAIMNMYNRILSGERLNPEQRRDFVNQAKNLYEGQKQGYKRLKDGYKQLALRNKLNPDNIIVDYSAPEEAVPEMSLPPISKTDAINELRRRGKI